VRGTVLGWDSRAARWLPTGDEPAHCLVYCAV
jgi:hypothetical protein